MADIKISALPGASTLTGTETIPLVQGGTTKKVTTDQFLIKDASGNVGLGVTPSSWDGPGWMQVANGVMSKSSVFYTGANAYYNGGWKYASSGAATLNGEVNGERQWHTAPSGTAGNAISFTQAMTLDASGNLGLGATPQTWASGARGMRIGAYLTAWTQSNGAANLSFGAYEGSTLNVLNYATTGDAPTLYRQLSGVHSWLTAPSGTAGNPISFTQAMTLDASGNLTTANDRINLITVGRGGGGVASNTASGLNALQSNTTGYYNTASGLNALQSNTTGYYNTASGLAALYSNTTGYCNTASGLNALQSNTTGYYNTASGVSALYYNTTGYSNTASGYAALQSNTTGHSNTASGVSALHYNTTGASNTASGYAALQSNTTGHSNTASGVDALYYNTTGYNNTASGRSSGYNPDNDIAQYRITSDFDMTLVGYGATKDNAGQLWNSTAIGARAKVTKSNQVVLGDSNVTETLINGDLVQKVSTTAATLTANGTLTFSIVNDTTLRISVRGSDGTTRTATVALS